MEPETNLNQDSNSGQQQQQQQQQQFQRQQQYYPPYPPSDNLNTLSTLHLVKGILTMIFSLFFVFYAFMGGLFTGIAEFQQDPNMPFNPGIIFIVIGIVGFVITIVLGIVTLLASKYLKQRSNYTFVFAIAVLNCLSGILGILLGVFTIVELTKPHIKAQFEVKDDVK